MTNEVQAIPAEQAADLAALTAAAGEGVPAANQEPAPAGPDLAGEIASLISMLVAALSPALPSLKATYTEEVTAAAAGAVAGVCEKHGWMQGGMFGEWGVEIAAAAVLVPLGVTTYQGVKGDIAAAKEKQRWIEQRRQADFNQHMNLAHNADGQTEPVGSGKAVTFGNAVPAGEGAA